MTLCDLQPTRLEGSGWLGAVNRMFLSSDVFLPFFSTVKVVIQEYSFIPTVQVPFYECHIINPASLQN